LGIQATTQAQFEIGVDMHAHTHLNRDKHDAQMLQAIQTYADSETEKATYLRADIEVKEH